MNGISKPHRCTPAHRYTQDVFKIKSKFAFEVFIEAGGADFKVFEDFIDKFVIDQLDFTLMVSQ